MSGRDLGPLGPLPAMPERPPLGLLRERDVPIVDLLDRLLARGVAVSGDVVISVADVDLVRLGLRAVLQGIDDSAGLPLCGERKSGGVPAAPRSTRARSVLGSTSSSRPSSPDAAPPAPARTAPPTRLGVDRDDVERGLVQLVMTVVELVRELLERQALRRVDTGSLSDDQVERLGSALMQLDERMEELKAHFGLTDDDLRPRIGAVADLG
jgi:hypothetical protein